VTDATDTQADRGQHFNKEALHYVHMLTIHLFIILVDFALLQSV